MFYLVNFIKTISALKLKGAVFVLLTALLVMSGYFRPQFQSLFAYSSNITMMPYFNALVFNNNNIDSIVRKMENLPGVISVKLKDTHKIKDEIKSISADIDDQLVSKLISKNYQSLKIELEKNLRKESHALIQEYMTRLAGKDSVTVSQVKDPNTWFNLSQKSIEHSSKWGDVYLIGVISLLWLISCFHFVSELKRRSYLIENYQRRKFVGEKSIFIGLFALILLTQIIAINYYGNFLILESTIGLGMIVIAYAITQRKMNYKNV
jgi:hypothetical protein